MSFTSQADDIDSYNQIIRTTKPILEHDYHTWITLLKPRVLVLVVFTGICGILLAPGHLNPFLSFISILCISIASGACGALNMWFDRDIDAIMQRTSLRPLPAGKLLPNEVLTFGVILAAGSVMIMGLALNVCAACILALSICFYLIVYTSWLKRRTPQNIVIGGAAGAFPPLIGWASVTGSLDLMPLLMFLIIFVWTPSHFWCLALWTKDDYAKADIPMLPVVAGELHTRRAIAWYTVLLLALSEVPTVVGLSGVFYGLVAAVLSLKYIMLVYKVFNDAQDNFGRSLSGDRPAKATFKYSIWYLFLLFGVLVIEYLTR